MSIGIGFIGAGKMAEALIGGLIAKGVYSKDEIIACAPSQKTRDHISAAYGIKVYEKAADVVDRTDLIVLAVKPKNVPGIFEEEGVVIGKGKTVLSIVAGLSLEKMDRYVPDAKKVRAMPNHCCMVLECATGYTCDPAMTNKDKETINKILSSVGLAVEIPENQMEAVTGIAGSSPAFMYMVIDAMADAGVLNGLTRDQAVKLAAQSMLGSAKMVLETGKHPDQLKDEVCSPGGTTIVGVKILEDLGMRSAMSSAVDGTIQRALEMKKQ